MGDGLKGMAKTAKLVDQEWPLPPLFLILEGCGIREMRGEGGEWLKGMEELGCQKCKELKRRVQCYAISC